MPPWLPRPGHAQGSCGLTGSNLEKDKRYDQILHYPAVTKSFTGKGDVVDFYAGNHKPLFPGRQMTVDAFTYQLSDHLPLWIEVDTDTEEEHPRSPRRWQRSHAVSPALGSRATALPRPRLIRCCGARHAQKLKSRCQPGLRAVGQILPPTGWCRGVAFRRELTSEDPQVGLGRVARRVQCQHASACCGPV